MSEYCNKSLQNGLTAKSTKNSNLLSVLCVFCGSNLSAAQLPRGLQSSN